MIRELYGDVLKNISRVDFDKLWQGFHSYDFALYNSEKVYFKDKEIPWDNRFLGNTAIKFEDKFIAIWNVELDRCDDTELLAANLVHEMFHAFQMEHGEMRFPKDLITMMYPENEENFTVKYLENKILAGLIREENPERKKEYLEKFCLMRKHREKIMGKDTLNCEYLTETAEGMAEYMGISALRQFSEEKYIQKVDEYIKILETGNKTQFDIRRICYYSGAVFLLCIKELGIDPCHSVGEEERTVFEIISEKINPPQVETEIDENPEFKKIFDEYIAEKKKFFEETIKLCKNEITGSFTICGYDPMNMQRMGDYVICSHFIFLQNDDTGNMEKIFNKTLLKMEENSPNKVKAYCISD